MERNEIRSFKHKVSLEDYLEYSDILNTTKNIKFGNIEITQFKEPIKNVENDYIIGIFKDGSGVMKGIITNKWNINVLHVRDIILELDIVLKEQIKHLKYVEQLELFKNEKRENSDND